MKQGVLFFFSGSFFSYIAVDIRGSIANWTPAATPKALYHNAIVENNRFHEIETVPKFFNNSYF